MTETSTDGVHSEDHSGCSLQHNGQHELPRTSMEANSNAVLAAHQSTRIRMSITLGKPSASTSLGDTMRQV